MWILYSFASLLFLNFRNILTKFNVAKTHPYVSMWYTFVFQIPLGILAVLFTGIHITDSRFFALVLLRVILDIVAFMFFFKALKVTKLSLVLPFMALLPAITIFTSFGINGQAIQPLRLLLVFVIAFCCYSIYKHGKVNPHSKDDKKGILYIFIVIGLYSILDPLHAEILKISSPFTYFFISSIYFIIIWTSFVLIKFRKELVESFANKKSLLFNGANGVVLSLEVISLFLALVPGSITSVVTAIRSTNTATSSVIGGALFKEHLSAKKILLIGVIAVAVILLTVTQR